MKINMLISAAMLTVMPVAFASAACDETASASGKSDTTAMADTSKAGKTEGISKNGGLAPLEKNSEANAVGYQNDRTAQSASADTSSQNAGMNADGDVTGSIVKNGKTMPLAQESGGGDKERAMSANDVEAQQHGGVTAVERAKCD